jgi:8-oxo-dGTP diphosphatase
MTTEQKVSRPQVGVGVIVLREDKVLLGKRRGSHGAGTWALPGGHLEFGESVEACALRETKEETGLKVRILRQGPYTNDVMLAEGKHYVTVFVVASSTEGMAQVMEPGKCEGWDWFRWAELPDKLFAPLKTLVGQGFDPSLE